MPELKIKQVVYTNTSLKNATAIKKYLLHKFTQKEVDHFFSLLQSFEAAVVPFPKLYPTTNKKKNIRRAVLSKALSVFYRIENSTIEVLAILDNRCDLEEWIGK